MHSAADVSRAIETHGWRGGGQPHQPAPHLHFSLHVPAFRPDHSGLGAVHLKTALPRQMLCCNDTGTFTGCSTPLPQSSAGHGQPHGHAPGPRAAHTTFASWALPGGGLVMIHSISNRPMHMQGTMPSGAPPGCVCTGTDASRLSVAKPHQVLQHLQVAPPTSTHACSHTGDVLTTSNVLVAGRKRLEGPRRCH